MAVTGSTYRSPVNGHLRVLSFVIIHSAAVNILVHLSGYSRTRVSVRQFLVFYARICLF